jgi:hypothetical protein
MALLAAAGMALEVEVQVGTPVTAATAERGTAISSQAQTVAAGLRRVAPLLFMAAG